MSSQVTIDAKTRPIGEGRRTRQSTTGRTRPPLGWLALFLGPNIVLFTTFVVVPMVIAFGLSLFSWDLISPPRFVGLANFFAIPRDPRAVNSIVKTAYLIAIGVIPTVIVSFLLAVLINTKLPGIRVIRTIYLLPLVISFVASAVLWRFIFDDHFGPINTVLSWFGIVGPTWLKSTGWSMPAVAIVVVWLRFPLGMLLYLAALQSINPALLEAAQLDGANAWQRLRHIIWPSVRPVTFLVTIITLRGILFDSFDVIQVMTGGGPIGSTDILIKYIFDAAFTELDMGYASALATALFVIVAVLALVLTPPKATGDRD
ncbi:MAG TPA: sugar ABC transporter permease [Devosia sp.]|nr:sugar ABC transporter permease [Devosia sp.]